MTKTETINLLIGNNNCTCIEMEPQRSLSFAIPNPHVDEMDIKCPIYASANQCYSPENCNSFRGIIASFFHICEVSSKSENKIYKLCFDDISEQLNSSRLDFYIVTRTPCPSAISFTRTYIRSFELSGKQFIL